jgi:hypothetical protein
MAGQPQASSEQPQGSLALLRRYVQPREQGHPGAPQERPYGVAEAEWDEYRRHGWNPYWRNHHGRLIDLVEHGYAIDDEGRFTLLEPVPLCCGHAAW